MARRTPATSRHARPDPAPDDAVGVYQCGRSAPSLSGAESRSRPLRLLHLHRAPPGSPLQYLKWRRVRRTLPARGIARAACCISAVSFPAPAIPVWRRGARILAGAVLLRTVVLPAVATPPPHHHRQRSSLLANPGARPLLSAPDISDCCRARRVGIVFAGWRSPQVDGRLCHSRRRTLVRSLAPHRTPSPKTTRHHGFLLVLNRPAHPTWSSCGNWQATVTSVPFPF